MTLENLGSLADVGVGAAGTTGDDALVYAETAVFNFIHQRQLDLVVADEGLAVLFGLVEDVFQIGVQLFNGVHIGGMHGQCNHGTDAGQVHFHHAVIISQISGSQLFVVAAAAVNGQVFPGLVVGLPDTGQAGSLGGHDVDAAAVFQCQIVNAGAHKLHDLIFDIAVLEHSADNGQRHVLGANACHGGAGEIHCHHAGTGHVIGSAQQLLCQLAATFTDGHGAQCAVTGMAVGAQNHLTAACVHFAHILVDNCHVRGHEDAAVLFGSRQAEQVVVLIDGAAHGAQAVVAVGEHIGHGELFQTGSAGCLNDAHKGDIMAGHSVEFQLEILAVAALVVGL